MPGEGLHKLVMIIAVGEARLMPPELVSGVHLGDGQGHRGTITNAVKSDFHGTHRDVLEATHHQITLGIRSPSGIIRRKLEGLQLLH